MMKTLEFKNEKETADMVIHLQTANAKFMVTGRTEIVVMNDLDQQKRVNAVLNGFGIVRGCGFVQIVVRRASFVVNIGVAVALPFPPVVTLDAAYGLLLEFVHVEYEIGHGNTSLYQWMSRSFCGRNAGHFFRLRGTKVENMFGFGWTS